MNRSAILCLVSVLLIPPGLVMADAENTAELPDIDAGARSETSDDDDIMRSSTGPGEPQDPPVSTMVDGAGNTYWYGYPYGYGVPYGYGYGFIGGYGGYPQRNYAPVRGGGLGGGAIGGDGGR